MRVGECCNRTVVVCDHRSGICDAARLMRQFNDGTVVVVDRSSGRPRPIGFVTDRDLVFEVLARRLDPESVTLAELVGEELPLACADDGFWETFERMRARGFRRVIVVDRNGDLEGMLAVDDVLDLLSGAQRHMIEIARIDRAAERSYVSEVVRPVSGRVSSPGVAEWARVA